MWCCPSISYPARFVTRVWEAGSCSRFNLKQLESFVATVEHSGFTAAAAALYLTQSTVSAHVSALEQTLGVPLLVRGARRPSR